MDLGEGGSGDFALLVHRSLPSRHRLWPSSCCPTMDLAFMTFNTAAKDVKGKQKDAAAGDAVDPMDLDDTVGLFRLGGGAAPLIWQWKASDFATELINLGLNFDVRGAMSQIWQDDPQILQVHGDGGLCKEACRIRGVHWSPDGQYLAVVVTFAGAHHLMTDVPILLGVHDGQPSSAPLILSPPSHDETPGLAEGVNFVSWLPLQPPHAQSAEDLTDDVAGRGDVPFGSDAERAMQFLRQQRAQARVTTPAEKLIEALPALNHAIPQSGQAQKATAGGAAAAVAAALGPSQTGSGTGATLTGRPKRELSIARLPPSLPLPPSTNVHTSVVDSLLVVGTDWGRAHLFLAGTVYLGFVGIDTSACTSPVAIVAVQSLDSRPDESDAQATRLCFLWRELSPSKEPGRLRQGTADLSRITRPRPESAGPGELEPVLVPVPSPAAFENVRLSSLTATLFSASIQIFVAAISSWHDARELGERFVSKMQDGIRAHGGLMDARWSMGTLLFTGRPSDALRDFLSTKNTERALTKWTNAMNSSLIELREAIYQAIVPAAERLSIIANDRREHWFGDPEWRAAESTLGIEDADRVRQGVVALIEKMYELEDAVRKEHVAFNHLAKWLRYEVDVCIHHDSVANHERGAQDLRPWVKHDVLIVDDYLANRLEKNPLSLLLPKDKITHDTIENHLYNARAFRVQPVPPPPTPAETRDKLTNLMDWLLAEPKARPPAAPAPAAKPDWAFLPALELLLGVSYEFGEMFRHAFQRKPSDANAERTPIAAREVCSPEIPSLRQTKTRVIEGSSPARWTALVGDGAKLVVQRAVIDPVARTVSATPSVVELPVRLENHAGDVELVDFDFYDDRELLLVLVVNGSDEPHRLVTLWLDAILPADEPVPTFSHIPVHRSHVMSSQHVPCALAVNGREGRRTACVLGDEGRSLDVFDLETDEPEEDELGGSLVQGQEDEEMRDA